MHKYLIVLVLAFVGCVPEVAILTDCNAQRIEKLPVIRAEFVNDFVAAAKQSDQPLPDFVTPMLDTFMDKVSKIGDELGKNVALLQGWHGLPKQAVVAGSSEEKRNRATINYKTKVKNTFEDAGRAKLGLAPKPRPKPVVPEKTDFPWQHVGVWGGGALAALFAGKKTLDERKTAQQNLSLVKAFARARQNGGKESVDAALTGKDVPAEEIANTRAAYKRAKDLGEV